MRALSSASELAELLAMHVDALVPMLLPSARRAGGYWTTGSVAGEAGGSLYVHRNGGKAGKWTDAATGQFGDLLDLVNEAIAGGRDMPAAMRWATSWLGLDPDAQRPERRPRHIPPAQSAEDEAAIGAARGIWQKAIAADGMLAKTYLQYRGIPLPAPAVAALLQRAAPLSHGPRPAGAHRSDLRAGPQGHGRAAHLFALGRRGKGGRQ
jgi:hypothetical protein